MFVQDHNSLEELQQRTKGLTQKRFWLEWHSVKRKLQIAKELSQESPR